MTIMVIVAIVLLVLHWGRRNAVWGGATLGVIVGFIIGLITEDWNPLAISFVVGTFAGTIFEWVGKSAVAPKQTGTPSLPSRERPLELDFLQVEEEDTTYNNFKYKYSFSFPSSWSTGDLDPDSLIAGASIPPNLAHYTVCVLDHYGSPENDTSRYLKDIKREARLTLLSNPRSFSFQGYPACEVKYSLSLTDMEGEAVQFTETRIMVARGGYDYIVLFSIKQGSGQYEQELDAIHRSFKFTK